MYQLQNAAGVRNAQTQERGNETFVTLSFETTIPISCPPCTVTFPIKSHPGLVMSSCFVQFSSSDPEGTRHTVELRPSQTAGANSRIANVMFDQAIVNQTGSAWDNYIQADATVR